MQTKTDMLEVKGDFSRRDGIQDHAPTIMIGHNCRDRWPWDQV